MLRVSNSLWIISDTHFGHHNIIKYCGRPGTHEVIMLSNWIDRVGEEDHILHLGDVFLGRSGNPLRWAKVIARLPGKKFLILGNHDKAKKSMYEDVAGFTIVDPFIHKSVAFSHRPVTEEYPLSAPDGALQGAARLRILSGNPLPLDPGAGWDRNVHGHIHQNSLAVAAERHGDSRGILPNKKYINVSVEVTDLAPVQLGQVCPL